MMRALNRRLARAWLTLFLRGLTVEPPPHDLVLLLNEREQELLRRRIEGDA